MTIVFDTNVLFAALTAKEGFCARLFEICASRHGIVISDYILGELRRNLAARGRLSVEQVDAAISAIHSAAARIVVPAVVNRDACRDPNDLPILGAAVAGNAQFIVTGDKDLLVVGEFQGILMISPRDFSDKFVVPGENPIA